MPKKTVAELFDDMTRCHDALKEAKNAVGDAMLMTFRKLMPPGTILKLGERPLPAHLIGVRTLRGNDRGTTTFEIVNVLFVEVSSSHPVLSNWVADAIPISEKTGKTMKASTGHKKDVATVRLHGHVGNNFTMDDRAEDPLLDLIRTIEANQE